MEESKENKTRKISDKNDSIDKNITDKHNSIQCDDQCIRSDNKKNIILIFCIIAVFLAIFLEVISVRKHIDDNLKDRTDKRGYWVYSAKSDVNNPDGLLKHVHRVLERIGYEKQTNETHWKLLWSFDYPFRALYPNLHRLKPDQKVNHFPATGFITNKVDLATSESKYIPKAFKIPENKDEFLKYARDNEKALFLEKNNQHRGVYLKNISEIDLSSGESFVQEYIQNPFLVDGYKFDIGVYVVLTSVNPLRVYWYKSDVLFRYCPEKYYPFDPKNLDKYVIGDDYRPTWKVPSLSYPYSTLGLNMKEAFDYYVETKGMNTHRMWEEVKEAIADVFIKKERHIIEALKYYPSSENFFEMMRFDLIVDENLKVYLLEANMSPNLSSAHYLPNQLLYEQVIYNMFLLTGVASNVQIDQSFTTPAANMVSSSKNIAVWNQMCNTTCKDSCEASLTCKLCKPCLNTKLKRSLLNAHKEYIHMGDYRRLFPPGMKPYSNIDEQIKDLNEMNKLQYLWYQGKCNNDITWCQ